MNVLDAAWDLFTLEYYSTNLIGSKLNARRLRSIYSHFMIINSSVSAVGIHISDQRRRIHITVYVLDFTVFLTVWWSFYSDAQST